MPDLISTRDAANRLGMTLKDLYALLDAGDLTAVRADRRLLLDTGQLDRFNAEHPGRVGTSPTREYTERRLVIRPLEPADRDWQLTLLESEWGSTMVARLGALVDASALEGFVAEVAGRRCGLITLRRDGDDLEVVTLNALVRRVGIGTALMDSGANVATAAGAQRLWLITTNANTAALRFYQRWGMDLARLHRDGVVRSRMVKPSIPLVQDGVALRHELELEWVPIPVP